MLTADNTFIINPLFYKSMPYQMSDLAPITLVASAPHMLAITKNAPAKSVQDFIAWAKSKPDTIMYGTTGPAGLQRLSMELFSRIAGIKLMQVPYKGAPEAITAVLTGEVTASINSVASLLPHVAAGNMRTLGVASIKRVALAPDIPTIQEQGVPGQLPGIVWAVWAGRSAGRHPRQDPGRRRRRADSAGNPGVSGEAGLRARRQQRGRVPRLHRQRNREVETRDCGGEYQGRLTGQRSGMNRAPALQGAPAATIMGSIRGPAHARKTQARVDPPGRVGRSL
jgi:hypothetical protein